MPGHDPFPRTALGISLLLHALFFLILGTAWLQRPRTSVTPGKTSIAIEWIAPTPALPLPKSNPVPEPELERILPAEAARAAQPEQARLPSLASQGAREAKPDSLHNPSPAYPEASRAAHEQGIVLIEVEVTAAGRVALVHITHSSGFPRLDQAALRAVREWKFEPAILGGIRLASRVAVPVRFELH